jgi:acetolactate synthase-1/2/3 large subunit
MAHAVAEAVVAELRRGGVDTVFGLPGGGPNLDKVGAAVRAGMRFVLAHGETAACIMASTYGLLTGPPGVCVVTRGPGVASAANGVAQATLDRAPLLLISDRVPSDQSERIAHQRLAQNDLMRTVTKWTGTVGHRRPEAVVAGALDLARRAPAGAVHLDYDPAAAGDDPPAGPERPPTIDTGALDAALGLVRQARRPVVIAGIGAVPAERAVRTFVRASGLPALTTYQARGLIPDSWPTAGGLFTNGAVERPLVEAADLIVTVGLDLVEPIPGEWTYAAPVLAVDAWEAADRYMDPAVRVVGDIDHALETIGEAVKSEWEPDAGVRARQRTLDALTAVFPGFSPFDVVEVASASCPGGATVTVDAGAHFLFVMPMWTVEEPRELLISNGLATMGFAVPAAIGAALARPARPVLCLVGDGGLGMTLAELETVARLRLPVTTIVFNDAALSLIEIKQQPDQGGAAAVRYGPVDFAEVARGFGLESAVATSRRDLERALSGSWSRPRLIDARIDPAAYRHALAVTRG